MIDRSKLERFLDRLLDDVGTTMTAALVVIGDKLGLYRAMAEMGSVSPEQLAQKTGTAERPVREWLAAQAAAGYIDYDAATARYTLPEEHALALADERSPVCMLGGFQLATAASRAESALVDAFRSGRGLGWDRHDPGVFEGTQRFFRPAYSNYLVRSWIPSLTGVEEKLLIGARLADVGCGEGFSTMLLARAYPNSTCFGFDSHAPSIDKARRAAAAEGVAERCRFEVASAKEYPAAAYDLVAFFDCLHDMGDPIGAAAHVRASLAPDGTWMVVEPYAAGSVEGNLTAVGRVYYSASTLVCTPASLAQEVGCGLGAQAGEARLRQVIEAGGFTRIRVATTTRFHMVIEARP